jgi:hypothetical protein
LVNSERLSGYVNHQTIRKLNNHHLGVVWCQANFSDDEHSRVTCSQLCCCTLTSSGVWLCVGCLVSLCSVLLTEYHSGDQVKKTEMGRTCSTDGCEERCIQGFSGNP